MHRMRKKTSKLRTQIYNFFKLHDAICALMRDECATLIVVAVAHRCVVVDGIIINGLVNPMRSAPTKSQLDFG